MSIERSVELGTAVIIAALVYTGNTRGIESFCSCVIGGAFLGWLSRDS